MPEEVKEKVSQEKTNEEEEFFNEPSMEDMIAESEIISGDEPKEKAEQPEEQTDDNESPEAGEADEQKAETSEKPEKEEVKSDEKPELNEETLNKLYGEYPDLKARIEEGDKYKNDYNNWERKLRQKSQGIPLLQGMSEEQQEVLFSKLMPFVTDKSKLPQMPSELVEDAMKNVSVEDLKFVDDDELEVTVPKDKILPQVKMAVEKALSSAVPEMAAARTKINELTTKLNETEQKYQGSVNRLGELELESLIGKHPSTLGIKRVVKDGGESESLLEAIKRISSTEDHPEHKVVDRMRMIGNLADEKGWPLDKAYDYLYGDEERKINGKKKAEEVAIKNQKEATQETPDGEKPKIKEEWEEALAGIGGHGQKVDDYFRQFEK